MLAAFVHLVLAYPAGRLPTRADRVIVAGGYALAVVANVLTLMFEPHPDCTKCATNVLLVADKPAVGARGGHRRRTSSAAILIAHRRRDLLVARYRAATPVARRMLQADRPRGGDGAHASSRAGFAAGLDRPARQGRPRADRPAHARERPVLVPRRASPQPSRARRRRAAPARRARDREPRGGAGRAAARAQRSGRHARRLGRGAARLRRSRRQGASRCRPTTSSASRR